VSLKLKGVSQIKAIIVVAVFAISLLSGCDGGQNFGPDVRSIGKPDPRFGQMLDLIAGLGMTNWADFGRGLNQSGRIRLVTTVELDPEFNAFSWLDQQCIWYSEIAFVRYPRLVDQSEILLHELVHVKTGDMSHERTDDPVCAEFRQRADAAGYYVDGPPAD